MPETLGRCRNRIPVSHWQAETQKETILRENIDNEGLLPRNGTLFWLGTPFPIKQSKRQTKLFNSQSAMAPFQNQLTRRNPDTSTDLIFYHYYTSHFIKQQPATMKTIGTQCLWKESLLPTGKRSTINCCNSLYISAEYTYIKSNYLVNFSVLSKGHNLKTARAAEWNKCHVTPRPSRLYSITVPMRGFIWYFYSYINTFSIHTHYTFFFFSFCLLLIKLERQNLGR